MSSNLTDATNNLARQYFQAIESLLTPYLQECGGSKEEFTRRMTAVEYRTLDGDITVYSFDGKPVLQATWRWGTYNIKVL